MKEIDKGSKKTKNTCDSNDSKNREKVQSSYDAESWELTVATCENFPHHKHSELNTREDDREVQSSDEQ